jgi:Domain of unknown function (DUF4034)
MSIPTRLLLAFLLSTLLLMSSCSSRQAFAQQDDRSLTELAVTYGQARPAGATPSSEKAGETPPTSPVTDTADSEEAYKSQMANYLLQKNYDALEEAAHQARTNKTRFKGGAWKLYDFYDAITEPQAGDQAPSETWDFHLERVKAWELARPDSATAHIALAETYVKYAGQARGAGYANTVSEPGWKLYGERVALAASTLTEAANLRDKCPYWFEVMQQVALAQGWDKSQARKLLDAAVAFEPTYYHYCREHANFLLPKWYGDPGEAEAFAEEVSNKVGGEQGKFLYFEIASLVTCQCDSNDTNMEYLSWPKIKEGYAALGQLYGISSLKMNRFAHMAVEAHDKDTAQQAFSAIGDDWDYSVWRSGQNFDNARNWARSQ